MTVQSAEELSRLMSIWDQTVGCDHCNSAWWGENNTEDPTLFHAPDCPCYGRRDVAEYWFNLDVIESELGRRCGL